MNSASLPPHPVIYFWKKHPKEP